MFEIINIWILWSIFFYVKEPYSLYWDKINIFRLFFVYYCGEDIKDSCWSFWAILLVATYYWIRGTFLLWPLLRLARRTACDTAPHSCSPSLSLIQRPIKKKTKSVLFLSSEFNLGLGLVVEFGARKGEVLDGVFWIRFKALYICTFSKYNSHTICFGAYAWLLSILMKWWELFAPMECSLLFFDEYQSTYPGEYALSWHKINILEMSFKDGHYVQKD